jgi:hypothetical protein
MALRLVSIDNNATDVLFPKDGFHPEDLMQTVLERQLHLNYPEDSLAEALGGREPEWVYERFLRIADFADLAGPDWFSVGVPLKAAIDQELKFNDSLTGPERLRYAPEFQADFFSRLRAREAFNYWSETVRAEHERWSDAKGRLAKDQADCARGMTYERLVERHPEVERAAKAAGRDLSADYDDFVKKLATRRFVEEEIAKIADLSSNWAMEMLVEDPALRGRITSERCPTLAAYAGALSLNRCGATLGVRRGWHSYGCLAPALNDYTDARIIASAAYAEVLVSADKDLSCRAKLLQDLKLFRPEVMTWAQLLARPRD